MCARGRRVWVWLLKVHAHSWFTENSRPTATGRHMPYLVGSHSVAIYQCLPPDTSECALTPASKPVLDLPIPSGGIED